MRRREQLAKATSLAGRPDLMRFADLAAFSGDDRLYQDLLRLANDRVLLNEPELHPFIPAPAAEELPDGGVFLGDVIGSDARLLLPTDVFGEGVGVVGTTGSGKSVTLAMLVRQLVELGIKVWIFDSENEFPGLLWELVRDGELDVVRYSDLRRNIFEPAPGELPMEAIGRVGNVLHEAFYLRDGSHELLTRVMTGLFAERGVFGGSTDYPCVQDVDDKLQGMRLAVRREAEYHVTAKRVFGDLVRNLGHVYEASQGFPLEELLEHNIVWALHGLDQYHHSFFVQDILSWVLAYRERHRPRELTHVFVIDEVHRLVSGSEQRSDLGEPLLVRAGRTTRRAGIGLLVADQVPSRLPAPLLGNLGTRIVLRLFDGRDVWAMGTSMSLMKEQMEYLPRLGPRRAVVHSKLYPTAFLIELPELGG